MFPVLMLVCLPYGTLSLATDFVHSHGSVLCVMGDLPSHFLTAVCSDFFRTLDGFSFTLQHLKQEPCLSSQRVLIVSVDAFDD